MNNLATKSFMSRALILLVLGLIAAQPFVVTWPAFAKRPARLSAGLSSIQGMSPKQMITSIPLGPSSEWWVFCWYFYIDEKDSGQVPSMQACQRQSTYFAKAFPLDSTSMQWPIKKLDQLNLKGMSSAQELQSTLQRAFKDKSVLSDSAVAPDLFDYERPDAINDITKFDPNMKMAGTTPMPDPDTAFQVFCQIEKDNGVITDVTSCQNLATPFMDDSVMSMFASGTDSDVMTAWLAGNSLQVMALKANVQESDWMDALSTAIGQDSGLMALMGKKGFMDDLFMWAPMPLLGGGN